MNKLSERIKMLRERNNISQSELAKKLETTRATVSSWEMGVNSPNAHFLIELSKYFKVSSDYLLGLDNSENINMSSFSRDEKKIMIMLAEHFDKNKQNIKGEPR